MAEHTVPLNNSEQAILEEVRRNQGLSTIDQAAEWLAKSALRKAARRTSGRGRALYPVRTGNQESGNE